MACYHPLAGWLAKQRNASGKRSIVFNVQEGYKDKPVSVPCGRCIGCRLERARQWAVRCMHEASLHEHNAFVTLTYGDSCPESLRPRDFVLFMKRLRKAKGSGIRFFQCGEYGDKTFRPHHHALLFNCRFDDMERLRSGGADKNQLYSSASLDKLWSHGFGFIGTVTFESAGYVARYAMKKVVGAGAAEWYQGRVPEYLTMSRRPGVGAEWLRKFGSDVYPSDELVVNGVVTRPPRFYDDKVEARLPSVMRRIKRERVRRALADPNSTGPRLLVREAVKEGAIRALSRSLEA